MRHRQLADGEVRTYAVILEWDDDLFESLLTFAEKEDVAAGSFTAIGAFARATLAFYDLDRQEYEDHRVDEQNEVASLSGTLATYDGARHVHAHAVLGTRDGRTVCGHLKSATVRPTLEVMVTASASSVQLTRRHDDASGLALVELEPGGA